MKKAIIICLSLLAPCLCSAQTVDNHALGYCVRYEKAHLFLKKDSGFNVVDYDVEWPEIVDHDSPTALKHAIADELSGVESSDLDSAITNVNALYGNPVTGTLKTIPDDRRFCYVTVNAKIKGYGKGHWIAYYIAHKIEPQPLSEFKAFEGSHVVVYDTSRGMLFQANELISDKVTELMEPQEFYDTLFAPLPDDIYSDMKACEISGVWVDGSDLCFLIVARTATDRYRFTSTMPLAEYSYVLSREGKRIFTKDAKPKDPKMIMASQTWHGDTIYNNVEKMPEFRGGTEGLRQYLSHVTSPEVKLDNTTKVYTSYIIDKDGDIRDVSVVSPVTPELDRHAVAVIKGMPKYSPGEQDGRKVCVRLYMPITYRQRQ